uniref:Uncharacterized protein n=1 Tax=Aegilops tauschii TaxID=37682 RepID=M8C616_AEGTA
MQHNGFSDASPCSNSCGIHPSSVFGKPRRSNACWQVERDVETVINVLQPGPIGIVEHKFTDAEIREAQGTVRSAVQNWRRNWNLERNLATGSIGKSK